MNTKQIKSRILILALMLGMLTYPGSALMAAGEDNASGGIQPIVGPSLSQPVVQQPVTQPAMPAAEEPIATIAVAAGAHHALALTDDGEVWAWGQNQYGQLGQGTKTNLNIPRQVDGLPEIKSIAAGAYFSLALSEDGKVYGWGHNDKGQIGNAGSNEVTEAVRITGLDSIVEIDAGFEYAMARKADGTVYVWGDNTYGQLMKDNLAHSNGPIEITDNKVTGIQEMAAGGQHCLVRKADGSLLAWGDNTFGQLGDNTSVTRDEAVVVDNLSDVKQISGGLVSSMALTEDGDVYAWGHCIFGELGINSTSGNYGINQPYKVNSLSGVRKIEGDFYNSFFILDDSTVKACGSNNDGSLGTGDSDSEFTPVRVNNLENVSQIAAGGYFTLALMKNGTVMSWGDNAWGELGNGTSDASEYGDYPENYVPDICLAGHWNGPEVLESSPSGGQNLHNLEANIEITFDVAVEGTGDFRNVTLTKSDGTEVGVHRSIEGSTVILDPANNLESGQHYTVNILSSTVKDEAGNWNHEEKTIHFTT